MDASIPGKPLSLWMDTAPATGYPALEADVSVDVAVLGGGLAGLTAADFLTQAGLSVAVLEAGRIGSGVSGFTTAKITSLHTLIYKDLLDRFGREKARLYGEANEWAIRHISETALEAGIDCDFTPDVAYTYAMSDESAEKVRAEAEVAKQLGLPASIVETTSLPFEVKCAVRFDGQARFHPRKYMLGLADKVIRKGGSIYENTRATDVDEEGATCTVTAGNAKVRARYVLVLTHYPFYDKAMFFARLSPQRSYAMAVKVSGELPDGMFISADEPERSVRRQRFGDGDILIVGGEVHKTGKNNDTRLRYLAVADWARQNFQVEEFLYHWSTQDPKTLDGVPYIGRATKGNERVFMASGFDGWGMTGATVAGKLISDLVLGRENPWEEVFDPIRSELTSAGTFTKENVNVAKHLIGDKITGKDEVDPNTLQPGEGRVVEWEGQRVGAFKDDNGGLHVVSPACTHMGCELHWNTAERSWDCPCHGSRFSPDGDVLHGPAVSRLPRH